MGEWWQVEVAQTKWLKQEGQVSMHSDLPRAGGWMPTTHYQILHYFGGS